MHVALGSTFAETASAGEMVGLVTDGRVHVRAGLMAGNLGPGDYFHVRRDLEVDLDALDKRATLLLFRCLFENFAGAPARRGRMSRDASSGPLANLRIVELANVVAGPSVGTYLSDFGAEVIKIEQPADGDPTRSMGEAVGEMSAWWLVLGGTSAP